MRERRRIGDARKIVGVLRDLPPVVAAEHDGDDLLAHVEHGFGEHERIDAERHEKHDEKRGIHAEDALQIIASEGEAARETFRLRRIGEQIPRQNKKQGYPEVSSFHHIGKHMKQRDCNDCQGAQGVDPRNVLRRFPADIVCHKSPSFVRPPLSHK